MINNQFRQKSPDITRFCSSLLGELPEKPIFAGSISGTRCTFTTTDAAGRFLLCGADSQPRIIAISDDGHLVQSVMPSDLAKDLKIIMPEPATLIVHYDIPGDTAKAEFGLALRTNDLDMSLWKDFILDPWVNVQNGGQSVLNDLTPGTYDFSRNKNRHAEAHLDIDRGKILLGSGRTQMLSIVRSKGRRVKGQATGFESITNSAGAFLFVGSATAISSPLDFRISQLNPCYDSEMLDTNGFFQTALLEPGNYTLIAEVYAWGKPPEPKPVHDDEPQTGGMWFNLRQLAYVGSTNVTVTTKAAPPVKIKLRPWIEPAKSP